LPGAAGAAGIVAVLGFVTTAFTSPDRLPALHVQSAVLSFRAGCVASLLVTTVMIRDPRFPRRSALAAAGIALLLIVFVGVTAWGPGIQTDEGLVFQVATQKIVVLATVLALAFVGWDAERGSNGDRRT
jgi:hypothetical protein